MTVVAFGQQSSISSNPEIGKPVPVFELKSIGNFHTKSMSSLDFKGRHVIIDFWNKNCISCVQSFPKLNQVHEKYKDKLDLILVGTDEEGIEQMFETFREKLQLKFPFAFNRPMYNDFVPAGAPHLVWIDDKGIVKAISAGSDMTDSNIEAFLQGREFTYSNRSHSFFARQNSAYTLEKPFLVRGNGGDEYESTFRYRSLIAEYIPGSPKKSWPDINLWNQKFSTGVPDGNRRVFEGCANLKELYTVAYTGWVQWGYADSIYKEVHGQIILDMPDTSLFVTDRENGTGLYWYSLIMPGEKASPSYVMESMQNDLKRYFGYKAQIETRKFPYLRVLDTDRVNRLKNKGKKREVTADHSMLKAQNISLEELFQFLFGYHDYWETQGRVPAIINETGIDFTVDVDVKVNSGSWQDVKRCLAELGFELVPGEKEFKTIVIRAPEKK